MALVAKSRIKHGIRKEGKVGTYIFEVGQRIQENLFSEEELERLKTLGSVEEGEPTRKGEPRRIVRDDKGNQVEDRTQRR